ncbi:hypothetical protein GIB67_020768 [Kingdonia uniflora]|uniref:Retrotransposon Copia-like N-terminal domain-containing protein n=1 Tax=Kingdonia uniflora TaxID=39325 RepID=A0A7J7M729_9MAGN|nr:hypothetical protein GIB67_020768 [Kingdonia uniflora]
MTYYLRARKKLKYLTEDPPKATDTNYDDWMSENSMVCTWMWHSMEHSVAANVQFLPTAKKIWE